MLAGPPRCARGDLSRAGGTRRGVRNETLEEPATAMARSLAGLDVHAAKIVAAVLDADTGERQFVWDDGENTNAAAFCQGNRNGAAAGPPRCSSVFRCVERFADGPQLEMGPFGADDSDASDLTAPPTALRVAR